jgi:hypothetical protein
VTGRARRQQRKRARALRARTDSAELQDDLDFLDEQIRTVRAVVNTPRPRLSPTLLALMAFSSLALYPGER